MTPSLKVTKSSAWQRVSCMLPTTILIFVDAADRSEFVLLSRSWFPRHLAFPSPWKEKRPGALPLHRHTRGSPEQSTPEHIHRSMRHQDAAISSFQTVYAPVIFTDAMPPQHGSEVLRHLKNWSNLLMPLGAADLHQLLMPSRSCWTVILAPGLVVDQC